MTDKIIDSEYAKNMRRSALYELKALVSSMAGDHRVDNPRKGYKHNIEKMEAVLETLKWNRATEEGYEWDWGKE